MMEKGSTTFEVIRSDDVDHTNSGHVTNRHMHVPSALNILEESDSNNSSKDDDVVELSLGLGSNSNPSSHGASSSRTFSSGGPLDSERKVDKFGGYSGTLYSLQDRIPMAYFTSVYDNSCLADKNCSGTLYSLQDRIPMPYFMSVYDSSCLADKNCSDKESTKKTFIPFHTSIKNIKEEIDSKHNGFNNMGSLSPKISLQKFPSTINLDDNDPDVCILEDTSQPPPKKRCHVDEKFNISGKWSSPSASTTTQDGFNHTRFEKKDEQSVYRAALQRIALSWMVQKETRNMHCVGGILADDQGLGKTISTIALILKERSPPSSNVGAPEVKKEMPETLNLYDVDQEDVTKHDKPGIKIENSIKGTKSRLNAGTLIVCPTSVIRQWYDELNNKVSAESRLSVLIYHGTNRTKDPAELTKYDVVLTTYPLVSMEVPIKPLTEEDYDEDDYNNFYRATSSTKKRKLSKKAKGAGKWVLESSLRPLAKVRWFSVILDEAQIIKNHRTKASRACWGLKAKRRWCLSGTPIQNAIDDLYSYFRFLRYDPYDELATFPSTIKNPIKTDPKKGYKKLQAILTTMLLRRTKATLIDGKPIISLPPKTVSMEKLDFTDEELELYTNLEENSRSKFQEYSDAGTVEQNYASILVLLLRLRQACGHPLLVTGSSSSPELESSLEEAKQLLPEKRNRLLSCLEASSAICDICGDPPEDAVVTTCEHVFCKQCILERLSSDDCECLSSGCKAQLDPSLVFSRSALRLSNVDQNMYDCSSSVKAEHLDHCSSNVSVKSEPLDYYISNDAVNSSKIEAARALESSKITAAMEYLHSIVKPQEITMKTKSCPSVGGSVAGEKAIVFSQWTKMLDLFEACLRDSSIGFRRLDGTMSIPERDKAVKDFNRLPQVSVMIMSLKAASLGLNMVAANHVLLLDLWWNPTTEEQAIDRAHRIGQTRPVKVLRLTVKETIEDRILELQKKKREMVASAFGEDEAGRRQTRLTVNDLKYLFGFQ
nr:helicase-like transcription factor CHR28 [Tanacetum cinerariifolium]